MCSSLITFVLTCADAEQYAESDGGAGASGPLHMNMNVSAQKVPMGTRVDAQHSSFALVQAMLVGIEAAVSHLRVCVCACACACACVYACLGD